MTTTDAQKTPMPATIKPCWEVRFEGGGTSGIRIFLDLDLIVMQNPWSILNAMSGEPPVWKDLALYSRFLG
jgi:hypothetical protein